MEGKVRDSRDAQDTYMYLGLHGVVPSIPGTWYVPRKVIIETGFVCNGRKKPMDCFVLLKYLNIPPWDCSPPPIHHLPLSVSHYLQDDDHDAEEWERYEAYQEDVDKQVIPLMTCFKNG